MLNVNLKEGSQPVINNVPMDIFIEWYKQYQVDTKGIYENTGNELYREFTAEGFSNWIYMRQSLLI